MTLEQVRSSGDTLAAVKELAFHILDFALRLEESWPYLRELLSLLRPLIETALMQDQIGHLAFVVFVKTTSRVSV